MKLFYLLCVTCMLSCSTYKIDNDENFENYYPKMKGRVSEVKVETETYSNDSIITYYFNKNKKPIKAILNSINHSVDTVSYEYVKNRLVKRTTKKNYGIFKTEFYYDNSKKLIKRKYINNGELGFETFLFYNRKNSIIEIKNDFIEPKRTQSEKINIDYKNRTIDIVSYENDKRSSDVTMRKYYDKKGNIYKSEFIYNEARKNNSRFSLLSYNKYGQIECTKHYSSGKQKDITCNKYTYDKKGNIITEEIFYNENLSERTKYQIKYK
ncbi:hypothetical protein [Epilithonimonas caeni]|uniref:hypothetical protein n=1 Tax=Epilithonimonas caeni TaxID=365343 RepID=UPI0003F691BA|nr:hypothetical protein [Epilithonimonas caeni]